MYNKCKGVYDNPKYFDQQTGKVKYPGEYEDVNKNGFINGEYTEEVLQEGTIIDRYGSNRMRKFFSPEGTPYEEGALPPFMENQPYTKYKVLTPIKMMSGDIAVVWTTGRWKTILVRFFSRGTFRYGNYKKTKVVGE